VNARRIPAALQEPLSSGVNALSEQTPPCLPAVPAATVTPPAPAPKHGPKPPKHRHEHHGHGKGRG
jgi:hypothetical protein